MKWTVAACQMQVTTDVEKNLKSIVTNIEQAKRHKANVICFPEGCLIEDELHARTIPKELGVISAAAKEHGIHVIFGTYLVDSNKKIRNQVLVIDKNGAVVHRYNKENKYRDELDIVVAGKRNRIFMLDAVHCAVFICWDYAFPEDMRELAAEGVDVIFCPSYLLSHPFTHNVLDRIPQVRAFDTMSHFVMVDAYADETYQHSKICHPLRCLAEISGKPGVIYAEIDFDDARRVRGEFPNMKRPKSKKKGASHI